MSNRLWQRIAMRRRPVVICAQVTVLLLIQCISLRHQVLPDVNSFKAVLPADLMTTMALIHFWRFRKLGGKGRALMSAVTLGVSQLAKYSCVYLYPIFLMIATIYRRSARAADAARPSLQHRLIWASSVIAVFAAVSILMINLGFGFNRIGTSLSGYALKDSFFHKLQVTPIIGNLPVPL